jgi:hypothetical protein
LKLAGRDNHGWYIVPDGDVDEYVLNPLYLEKRGCGSVLVFGFDSDGYFSGFFSEDGELYGVFLLYRFEEFVEVSERQSYEEAGLAVNRYGIEFERVKVFRAQPEIDQGRSVVVHLAQENALLFDLEATGFQICLQDLRQDFEHVSRR